MFSTYCTFVNVLLRVSLCFAKPFIGWEPSILSPECADNSVVAANTWTLNVVITVQACCAGLAEPWLGANSPGRSYLCSLL